MGRYDKIEMRVGFGVPSEHARSAPEDIPRLLELSRDDDPVVRRIAAKNLCPCHVRANVPEVWLRLFEMLTDPDPDVRYDVVHALADGSPRERASEIATLLEASYNDPSPKVRGAVRKVVSEYRKTGRVNVL